MQFLLIGRIDEAESLRGAESVTAQDVGLGGADGGAEELRVGTRDQFSVGPDGSSAVVKLETVSRGDAVAQDGIDQSVVSRRGQNSGRKERSQQHDRDHYGNHFFYYTCSHFC